MGEKDKLSSTKIKYGGIFDFAAFYKFCWDWLRDEVGLNMSEEKYKEKLSGDSKKLEIKWVGFRDMTDYFRFEMEITFNIVGLTNVEIMHEGKKIKTNKGEIEVGVKGTLVRDYKSKFEKTAFQKFLRAIYEKTVIHARIEQFEEKIIKDCDEFLAQGKAYLDLEGKR